MPEFDVCLDNATKDAGGLTDRGRKRWHGTHSHHHLQKLTVAGEDNWHLNVISCVSAFQYELKLFLGDPAKMQINHHSSVSGISPRGALSHFP